MAMAGPSGMGPVMVLNANTQRKTGREAQLGNIMAARAVADIIRTTLGPRSMLKMLLDPMGGVVITNDGNCILREIDVSHPTAKSMIELSRAQDEEVGDGTTSVIILAGEMLISAEHYIRANLHPTIIVQGYNRALQEALLICEQQALVVDVHDSELMKKLVQSCIGTKFSSRWNDIMVEMALKAVLTVARPSSQSADGATAAAPYNHKMEVDIKRYAKVEKIPGGEISDSCVLNGVMFNKDVTHSKMRRRIENPRILLIDSPLEYKKGESQTNVEITNDEDWNTMLAWRRSMLRTCAWRSLLLSQTLSLQRRESVTLHSIFLLRLTSQPSVAYGRQITTEWPGPRVPPLYPGQMKFKRATLEQIVAFLKCVKSAKNILLSLKNARTLRHALSC